MLEQLDQLRSRLREDALTRGHSPRDVDLLLSDLLGKSLSYLYSHGEALVDPAPLMPLLERRYAGEPLQYIRGRTEFYSREFLVDDRVLIPRPETELLVETALERAPRGGRIVDLGTGSGCIAISIERERPDLRVVGIDSSPAALALAAYNAKRLGSRVRFAGSDLLSALRGEWDVIVSNPPYIPHAEYVALDEQVRLYEPRLALTPGPRGTETIARIFDEAESQLARNGLVMMEVGYGQEAAVRELAATRGWTVDAFLPDLAGIPRIVVSSRHGD